MVVALSAAWGGAIAASANAATTPKPSSAASARANPPASGSTPACQKATKEIVNADNVYTATQYGIIAAAKAYLASKTLVNQLAYNESFATVFKAANAELNIAIKNPKCYNAASLKSYIAGVKTNSTQIALIQTYIINGQIYYDPQKATVLKPVGLLK